MKKVKRIQLKWTYLPADYIEWPIEIEKNAYNLSIANGMAVADIAAEAFNNESKEYFGIQVKSRLLATLITTGQAFELTECVKTEIYEDGSKSCSVELKGLYAVASTMNVDLEILKDGEVISSTKNGRQKFQQQLAEAIATNSQTDHTLNHMLGAIQEAEKDYSNRLVHLYEVREALQKNYGSAKTTQNILSISKPDWDELGNLTNGLPLRQGRHRGQHVGNLRNATNAELNRAKELAVIFLIKYINQISAR